MSRQSFAATFEAISEIDDWFTARARACDLADEMREELRVCVQEIAANIVMHGAGARRIEVEVVRTDDQALVLLRDDGPAFDPLARPVKHVAERFEDLEIGGLGLTLVKRLTDRLDYRREAGWNVLTMARSLTGPPVQTS